MSRRDLTYGRRESKLKTENSYRYYYRKETIYEVFGFDGKKAVHPGV